MSSSIFQYVLDIPSFLWETVINPEPTWMDLATIIAATGTFWAIYFTLGARIIRPLVANQNSPFHHFLVRAATREYHAHGKQRWAETFRCPLTLEEFQDHFIEIWPWMNLMCTQHFVDGLLCLPAVANLFPNSPELASSLACLAILSEAGWEIGDLLGSIYGRYFTKGGGQKVPFPIIVILAMHHSLGTGLGLPMVMYFRSSNLLHWLCFDLQMAGAIGLSIAEYTKLLDISQPGQLLQFQVLSFISLVVMVVTRGFHYYYLCLQVAATLVANQEWALLVFAAIPFLAFTIFNTFIIIIPGYKRFVKFLKVSNNHNNLPNDVTPEQKRNSLLELETAAVGLRQSRGFREELLLAVLSDSPEGHTSRRASLPARLSPRNSFLGGTIMYRLSMYDSSSQKQQAWASLVASLGSLKED